MCRGCRLFECGGAERTLRLLSLNSGPSTDSTSARIGALEIASAYQGEIHLLVSDVVMPHMLGREVAERVRALRPEIGVLFMSGYAESVLASQGRLEPGVVLLEKPFGEAELLAKVDHVLNGQMASR